MTTSPYQQDLRTLKELEAAGDYSRLSRRMLDFAYEYDLPSEFWEKACSLRALYYNVFGNTIAENQTATGDLKADASALLTSFENLPGTDQFTFETPGRLVFDSTEISKHFKKGFHLQPIDVKLKTGQITGVVGENGNGKTTLLRIIAGELMSDTGEAIYSFKGERYTNEWYAIRAGVGFIPQRIDRWYGSLYDNMRFFTAVRGIPPAENQKYVEYVVHRLGLMPFREHRWTEISSGYRLRFELARMLLLRPGLLVLDEPLANLDINAQQLIMEDLRYIAASRRHPISIIMSSQQLHEVERAAEQLIFLKKGETIFNGERSAFGSDRNRNSYEIEGDFTAEELKKLLADLGSAHVEETGSVLIIDLPLEYGSDRIFSTLVKANKKIKYFRDISTSSRKLFKKEF